MPGYGPGMMENMGGFDPSDLMARPEMRQAETRNQAAMVSEPYRQVFKRKNARLWSRNDGEHGRF